MAWDGAYVCGICSRPAHRRRALGQLVDLCDGCVWLLFERGWGKIADRQAETSLTHPDPAPIPFDEPDPIHPAEET